MLIYGGRMTRANLSWACSIRLQKSDGHRSQNVGDALGANNKPASANADKRVAHFKKEPKQISVQIEWMRF